MQSSIKKRKEKKNGNPFGADNLFKVAAQGDGHSWKSNLVYNVMKEGLHLFVAV